MVVRAVLYFVRLFDLNCIYVVRLVDGDAVVVVGTYVAAFL